MDNRHIYEITTNIHIPRMCEDPVQLGDPTYDYIDKATADKICGTVITFNNFNELCKYENKEISQLSITVDHTLLYKKKRVTIHTGWFTSPITLIEGQCEDCFPITVFKSYKPCKLTVGKLATEMEAEKFIRMVKSMSGSNNLHS